MGVGRGSLGAIAPNGIPFYEVAVASGDGKQIFTPTHRSAANVPVGVVGAFVAMSGPK